MPNAVDHPAHYNAHPSGVECIAIVEHFDFLIGNVIKYAWRAGLKPGVERLEDLKKMAWYAQRAVDKEGQHKPAPAPVNGEMGTQLTADPEPQAPTTGTIFESAGPGPYLHLPPTTRRPQPPAPDEASTAPDLPLGFEGTFVYLCDRLIEAVHQNARAKGFWDKPRNDGETIALVHSELSEALEMLRNGNPPDDKIPEFSGLEAELADAIIRIFDYAGGHNLRLAEAICAKVRFNRGRGRLHGKQF